MYRHMPVSRITNWNGEEIEAIQTKGGVWAFPNYLNGVICSNDCCSPPPELVQKLAKSDKYIHFYPEDQPLITRQLGYYTDLQSAHSEDAMVWSCFGTAADCLQDDRTMWAQWLVRNLGYHDTITKTTICLWRRVPHPDNFTQGGPELDALIQTDKVVILVSIARFNPTDFQSVSFQRHYSREGDMTGSYEATARVLPK
jgi:hypothetical protein